MSPHFLSKIIKVLAILALFTPLIISKSTLFPFIFGKAVAFQILVELMLIVYLIGLAKFPEWRPRFLALTWLILAFFVVLVLSTIFSADPYVSFWSKHERMEGLFTLSHYFAFFLVLTGVFRKKEDWLGFLRWSVIAAFLVSLHASAQWLNLPGFIKGIGVSGTLGNSSFLATYLVFNSFFALFLFLEKTNPRFFHLGCFLLFNFILLLTGTRAALYGQFLGLFVFFGLYGFFLASLRLKKIIAVSLVLAVVSVSLIFVFKDSDFVKGNRILARVTDVSLESATLQQRFAGWRTGLEGFKARPILGWGQENYQIVFYKFIDPYFYGPTETFDRPHNKYIDILVSNGVLGLLAYLGIFAVLFFWILRSLLKNRRDFVSVWFLGLAVAYLVQNALLFDMPTSYPFFFLTLGFANFIYTSSFVIARSPERLVPDGAGGSRGGKIFFKKILPVLNFVLIPAIVFVLWWGNLKPYSDSLTLVKALGSVPDVSASFDYSREFFSSPSFTKVEGRNVLANGLIEKSGSVKPPLPENRLFHDYALFIAAELEKGIKESPLDYRYYNSLTNLLNFLGKADPAYFEKSEEICRLALEIFPRDVSFLLKIFSIRFQFDDLDGAEAALKEALEKAPNSHLAHWNMALVHYRRQKFDLAEKEAETAVSLGYSYAGNLTNYNFLASIHFNLKDYSRAIDYFMEAFESFPENPQLIADIAVTYYRIGDKARAREWILKIVEISPASIDEVNKFLKEIGD